MADPSTAFVPVFQNMIVGRMQEDPEGIRSTVRTRNINGKTDHWEVMGGVNLVAITARHQATPYTPHTHTRRRAVLSDFGGAELLDDLDQVRMMIDPRNEYTQSLLKAWRRRVALTVTDALDAAATTVSNTDTTSTVALPASQLIANGGTGLTMAKLRQANRILDNSGIPRDGGRHIAVSAFGIEDLLEDSQVTSADYNSMRVLMDGGAGLINTGTFMGLHWHMISDAIPDDAATLTGGTADPILPKTGNIRTSFVWHRDGVGLSFAREATAEVDKRADLNNTWQVLLKGSLGAVRILDAAVVTIDYDESV